MTACLPWPDGYALREFDELDSTNEEARRLAAAGVPGPLWIIANRQRQGRGRRGRQWQSPDGNLFATLMLRPDAPISRCAQLSFVAAESAVELVGCYAPGAEIRVKWPNDILADGKKIAGILLESAGNAGAHPDWLVIGFGVNLAWHPNDGEFPATSLCAFVTPPSPSDALGCLAALWSKWYELWRENGFAPIREAWLAGAMGLGTHIRARLAHGDAAGVFEGMDENGALLLRETPERVRVISAGEIFFPPPLALAHEASGKRR